MSNADSKVFSDAAILSTISDATRARFSDKHITAESGCWEWQAGKDKQGYGRFAIRPRNMAAHRASWLIHKGALPSGLQVLHRCDNPSCVNPEHLFLGTPTDNMRDCAAKGRIVPGGHSAKTHCASGHEYTPETSYVNAAGFRRCRVCQREAKRRAWLAAP
jgi:hypothetical protein